MTVSMRPGGLTALAVLNFIIAGWSGLRALQRASQCAIVFAKRGGVDVIPTEGFPPDQRRLFEILYSIHPAHLIIDTGLLALCTLLALASGIGYLKQKRVLGFWVGLAYCVVALGTTSHRMMGFPTAYGGGVTPYILLSYFYPTLSIILLLTTFRRDLGR